MRDEHTYNIHGPAPTIKAPPALQGPLCGPSKQMIKTLNIEKDHTALHILYILLSYWGCTMSLGDAARDVTQCDAKA